MKIKSTKEVSNTLELTQLPRPDKPEYAFIGRSNVGKSSLINMLTGKKKLASTSKKPGRTRSILHYLINSHWYLVDLPGYGYAKVNKASQDQWLQSTRNYLKERANLQCVFLLADSRLPPQKKDTRFINWMGKHQIPFVLVFTKSDKPSKQELETNKAQLQKELLKDWEYLPEFFITSAHQRRGKQAILQFIKKINTQFEPPFILG